MLQGAPEVSSTGKPLSRDEFLAKLRGEEIPKGLRKGRSREEFLAFLKEHYPIPRMPSATDAFTGSLAETTADLIEAPALAVKAVEDVSGTDLSRGGLAAPFVRFFKGTSEPAEQLRGNAQAVYPPLSRGQGSYLGEQLPAALGSTVPLVGAGLAGGAGVALAGAAQNAVSTYYDVLDATGDSTKAWEGAAGGALLGSLEAFGVGALGKAAGPVGKLLGKADQGGKVRQLLLNLAATGAKEGIQEGVQQKLQDELFNGLTGQDISTWKEAAKAGAGVGVIFELMTGVPLSVADRVHKAAGVEASLKAKEAEIQGAPQAAQEAPGAKQAQEAPKATVEPQAAPEAAQAATEQPGPEVGSETATKEALPGAEPVVERGPAAPPSQDQGVVEMFAGPPSPTPNLQIPSAKKIRDSVRKWFVSEGNTPREARRELEIASGFKGAELVEVGRNARALYKEATRVGGKGWRGTDLAKQIDSAFKGEADSLAALPESLQGHVAEMRAHLDRLIREQVKDGGLIDPQKTPEFAKQILESQGHYARRSYRAYTDPNWADKVPADIRQRTFDLFRSWEQFAGSSDADINAELDAILVKAKESSDNPWRHLSSGKLGRKDLSIFKRRKEIPSELRAYLGEIEDPIANYAESVFRISGNIAKHEAYNNIRKQGLGSYLHEKPTGEYTARLSSEDSPALMPLNGLYTTPEIKEALKGAAAPQESGVLMKGILRLNSAIKWGKVIGQPWSFARNFQSNLWLQLANGHLPSFFSGKEWKAAIGKGDLGELKRLTRLGVVGSGVSTAEFQDLRSSLRLTPEELAKAGHENVYEKAKQTAELLYEGADNQPKIRFFYAEEAGLRRAGYSPNEAERLAADRSRDLMPTTDRMAEVFKRFRRQPFLGSFFSFRAEIIRTMANRLRLISEELKSSNPAVRKMGLQRAAGSVIAGTITPAAIYALNALRGIDAEEDKDRREFVPPWDANNRLLWFGEGPTGRYLDFSDVDPFTAMTDPFVRVMGGGDPDEAFSSWARDELDSYLGLSPAAQLMVDVAAGQTEDGRPIDDLPAYIIKQIQPGFIASARRARERGIGPELAATASGYRQYDYDAEKSLYFDIRGFESSLRNTTAVLNRMRRKSPEDQDSLYADAEEERKQSFEELSRKVQAAIRLGVPVRTVKTLLNDQLSKKMASALMVGSYVPYHMKPLEDRN